VNDAALDGLISAETALVGALDTGDIDAVEAAMSGFGAAVERMRASGPWAPDPALRDRVQQALSLSEAARVRIRYLSDRNQQRIDLLAAAAGRFDHTPVTYARP
jgi:hypothetical protein